jgi:hypothetical protein
VVVAAVVATMVGLVGCSSHSPAATGVGSTSATGGDALDVIRRPLHLAHVAAGASCPVTLARHQPDPALAELQGAGPAGPAGLDPDGTLNYADPASSDALTDKSWAAAKTLWATDPRAGVVLVRGRQLDGPLELRFNDPPVAELVLRPASPPGPGRWNDFPAFTRLRGPGCYAYQVDTRDSTSVIVFRASGPAIG